MRRDVSGALVGLYGAALVMMGVTVLALLGVWPGQEPIQVSGLTNAQAIGLTLVLMAFIALRLYLHLRMHRSAAAPPADTQTPPD